MADKNNTNAPAAENTNPSPIERFKALSTPVQVVLLVAAVFIIYGIFNRGGNEQQVRQSVNAASARQLAAQAQAPAEGVFSGIETDRPALVQSWFEQNRREISDLRDNINNQFSERDKALTSALEQNSTLQREMRQMLADFTAEIRSMEASSQRDKEIIGQMAEEMRQLQLNSPTGAAIGGEAAVSAPRRRGRISQTPLAASQAGGGAIGNPLLGGVARAGNGLVNTSRRTEGNGGSRIDGQDGISGNVAPLPFVPPLGFIRATLLNGFDALVGGQPTPALARLEGNYRTAQNSTVSLDGCFVLMEFQGEISTERAIGKPARMTCVYPDHGAVTYSLSGYVVDAVDGIIGVPGVFYEGDASRIAAALLADFASGVASIVEQNQNTFTVDSDGTAQRTITGEEARAELAGGVNSAVGSLRDYLLERASRVLPFVRIDNTREIHIVLLSGTELRKEGSPWTLLFDGENEIISTDN